MTFRRDLLVKLADYMRALKPSKFDFSSWWDGHEPKNGKPACGTVACIAGHAPSIPEFYEKGLRLIHGGALALRRGGRNISYGANAMAAVLGIPEQDAIELFVHGSVGTPAQAAKRIDRYLIRLDADAAEAEKRLRAQAISLKAQAIFLNDRVKENFKIIKLLRNDPFVARS